MSDSFADAALLLAGHAARALGWTPDIFWNATPAELAACLASNDDARTPPSRDEIAAANEQEGGMAKDDDAAESFGKSYIETLRAKAFAQ